MAADMETSGPLDAPDSESSGSSGLAASFPRGVCLAAAATALRVAVVYQFCIGQVLLDRLAGRAIYIAWLPESVLWALLAILGVAAPIVVAGVAVVPWSILWRQRGLGAARRFEAVIYGLLLFPFMGNLLQKHVGFSGYLLAIPAASAAGILAWLTVRSPRLRRSILWISPILLITPCLFFTRTILPIRVGVKPSATPAVARTPHPIVWIVLDEFSGVTLLDRNRELNTHRVPRLAEFAREADWYRNATSVYPRTDQAIPAMLTGRYPRAPVPPRPEHYPGQMFQRIRETRQFDEVIFEPYTRLAQGAGPRPSTTPFGKQFIETLRVLAIVWANDAFSQDAPFEVPSIPISWYGLGHAGNPDLLETRGVFQYSWDSNRAVQVEHFLRCLTRGNEPSLYFLHIALPHSPWLFTPSGKSVAPDHGYAYHPVVGGRGNLDETWVNDEFVVTQQFQRYLWQVRYADHQIGRILDRLRMSGLYDESLIIITGDHGASFRPALSRRSPEARNLADILWVPLFIKRPGQTQGRMSDRNVESIDLWPTVADSIGLPLSHPVEGQSLLGPDVDERPVKRFHDEKQPILVDATFEERWMALNDLLGLMGHRDDPIPARRFMPRPDLLGRALSECNIVEDGPDLRASLGYGQVLKFNYAPEGPLAPCWLSIELEPRSAPIERALMAVTLNGRIVALSRSVRSGWAEAVFTALIDESQFATGENTYQCFLVADSPDQADQHARPRLLPVRITLPQ